MVKSCRRLSCYTYSIHIAETGDGCGRPVKIIKLVVVRVPQKMTRDEWRTMAEAKQ